MPTVSKNINQNDIDHRILEISNREIPRIDFLQELSKEMLEYSECETLELLLTENDHYIRTLNSSQDSYSFLYEVIPSVKVDNGIKIPELKEDSFINKVNRLIFTGKINKDLPCFSEYGSYFCSSSIMKKMTTLKPGLDDIYIFLIDDKSPVTPQVVIPVKFGGMIIGTLHFTWNRKELPGIKALDNLEKIAGSIGIAILNQRTQSALHERVKELSCLYKITQVAGVETSTLDDILKYVVEILPPAWQFPEVTVAKIHYEGKSFLSENFRPAWQKQIADIMLQGKPKGYIEVAYSEMRPYLDEGPFLREERNLIDAIARQLALIIERKEAQKERLKLQEQLRHADRLAIIGQLAAGVAHELNEPLGSILGFAQLIKKAPDFPESADKDIDKIVQSSLHAREIIRKLLFFAREISSKIKPVNLNDIIENGLYFIQARCDKSGIKIIKELDKQLPEITADESQLHQVLINLIVNSIQAMPEGGKLFLRTYHSGGRVNLVVEDNGRGMDEDTISKIFIPFFTTKDINEGTGLGLAVVHGIVTSHKGRINVESQLGQGSRFEISLPV